MAQATVRIEIMSMSPGLQMATGSVVQSQTIELAATNDTATSAPAPSGLQQHHVAYIRVSEGAVMWNKGNTAPDDTMDSTNQNLDTAPGILRTGDHDAIPVRVFDGDCFSFRNVTA